MNSKKAKYSKEIKGTGVGGDWKWKVKVKKWVKSREMKRKKEKAVRTGNGGIVKGKGIFKTKKGKRSRK